MAKTKRPGLACLAKGGTPKDWKPDPLADAPFGERYVVEEPGLGGEAFDRARKNYQRFPAAGEISARPETMRGALATAFAGDRRMSPAKARFVEGLTGSTPAGGGLGVGLADFVPGLGAGLTASDMTTSDAPALDAAIGAGMQAAPFAGPLMRAGKAALTSRAGKAAMGATAAGAAMSPDEAEASLIGVRKALNVPISKYWRAGAMAESGQSANDIWRKTGFEMGRDGKWRFEVPDDETSINMSNILANPTRPAKLGDVVNAPSLYEQYPDLKDIQYYYDSGLNSGASYYAPHKGNPERIAMGPLTGLNNPKIQSYLLHEMQHAIQSREGFAAGSNPDWAFYHAMKDIKRQASPDGMAMTKNMDDPEWEAARRQGMLSAMDQLTPEAKQLVARGLYHRNAGEVEARNVQERARYTKSARETIRPELSASVPRFQQIFPEGGAAENLRAYERLLSDIVDTGSPYADGGAVEAGPDPIDELLALVGAGQ